MIWLTAIRVSLRRESQLEFSGKRKSAIGGTTSTATRPPVPNRVQ
jgi:hypothetical protein